MSDKQGDYIDKIVNHLSGLIEIGLDPTDDQLSFRCHFYAGNDWEFLHNLPGTLKDECDFSEKFDDLYGKPCGLSDEECIEVRRLIFNKLKDKHGSSVFKI